MTVSVLWLFLAVPWVALQCVIVVFPCHTDLLFVQIIIFTFLCSTLVRNTSLTKSRVDQENSVEGGGVAGGGGGRGGGPDNL